MQLSDDLEREMMNERGPNEFPAGVLKNGDRVEVVPGELMGADFPIYHMVIRRGNKTIRKALKTLFDDVEKRFDDINKFFDDAEKDESGKIDEVGVGLAIGRWEALNWVLGEEWDRSLVDVVSVSSSRDQEAIRQAYMEFWDKVWYNRSRYRIWQEKIRAGSKKDLGYHGRLKREKLYGKKNLSWGDFEWGILQGRLSGLSWVGGTDWQESLDT